MKKNDRDLNNPVTEFFTFVEDQVTAKATETQKMLERTTQQTGRTLKLIAENPVLKYLSDVLGADWLMAILGQVDVEQAGATVRRLQGKYPQDTPEQIAQRIMFDKAWEAGKIGLLTNIIPPMAVALLGMELAAMTKLQAEMIYQIAGAYGLDLHEPARRGEVLAIFGLSLGSGVLKAGVSWLEIIPGLGAVLGASTNATILYVLGYTACQFYEGKYKSFSEGTTS